jgi:predicted dehydrogenase
MTTKTIRWGIYGPGRIAHRFAEALQTVPHATLQGVAGRTPSKAHAFAQRHNAAAVLPDLASLANAPDVDAIYVATTHDAHCLATCACLKAGKAVLCEKPLAMNAHEVRTMVDAARHTGAFLMEALWTRFLPAWRRVQELLDQQAIGTPRMIHAHFGIVGSFDPKGRLLNKDLAGGALLDLGVYPVAMANMVCSGPVTSIQATGEIGPTGVDTCTAITLRFASGCIAQLSAAIGARTANGMTIAGDTGQISIPEPFWGATEIQWTPDGKQIHRESYPLRVNGFEEQIEEVNRCIRTGQPESHIMPHAASLAIANILDTVRQQIGLRYAADDAI